MNWRTDKPIAKLIVAYLKWSSNPLPDVLCKVNKGIYFDRHGEEIPDSAIVKWADLEEDETVTDCHQLEEAARTSWFNYEFDCGALYSKCYKDGFKAGAKWQREQDHDACYQCEKNYDNVFYRGEKHAIKMLKEEAIGGTVCGRVIDHINIRFADGVGKYLEPKDISHIPADKSKYNIGDKVKVIILKDE